MKFRIPAIKKLNFIFLRIAEETSRIFSIRKALALKTTKHTKMPFKIELSHLEYLPRTELERILNSRNPNFDIDIAEFYIKENLLMGFNKQLLALKDQYRRDDFKYSENIMLLLHIACSYDSISAVRILIDYCYFKEVDADIACAISCTTKKETQIINIILRRILTLNPGLKSIRLKTKLKEFPMNILRFEQLTKLDLSGSALRELPSDIGKLQHLSTLDLSRTDMYTLPYSIGGLKQLTKLDLRCTNMKILPESTRNLKWLEAVCNF